MIDLVGGSLEEIIQSQNNLELIELGYKAKSRKHNFSKHSLPIIFLRDIHEGGLSYKMLIKKKVTYSKN